MHPVAVRDHHALLRLSGLDRPVQSVRGRDRGRDRLHVGSIAGYAVGQYGGRAFVERWGKYVLLNMDHLHHAERFFERWGSITVLVCRMLPFVRSFIAFPAGVARMPLIRFHIYTFIGSWPWCFALAWAGMKLGAAWRTDPRLSHALHYADAAIVVLIAGGIVWFVWREIKKRRK